MIAILLQGQNKIKSMPEQEFWSSTLIFLATTICPSTTSDSVKNLSMAVPGTKSIETVNACREQYMDLHVVLLVN